MLSKCKQIIRRSLKKRGNQVRDSLFKEPVDPLIRERVHRVAPPYSYRNPERTNRTLAFERAFYVT